MLSHHKLKVYGKGVAVVASLGKHLVQWDKRHAVVDQLGRASESIVLNLVEGVRLRRSAQKQQLLDYAVGSALECAACVDIAVIKQFLAPELGALEKGSLGEVVRMLEGLRRSWEMDLLQAAAYLDLCVAKAELEIEQREPGIDLLTRIVLMLRALYGSSSG